MKYLSLFILISFLSINFFGTGVSFQQVAKKKTTTTTSPETPTEPDSRPDITIIV